MIPLLLLQLTLFQGFVQEAVQRVGIPTAWVQEMPVTPARAKLLTWVWLCNNPGDYGCGLPTVFIASDVASSAPRPVLYYLAYHEVCHLKLGHNLYRQTIDTHPSVSYCISQVLGQTQTTQLEAFYMSYAISMRSQRRRLIAP